MIEIVTGYQPGLIGRVAELHSHYYHENWGFGAFFEAKVASEVSEFIARYDDRRDRIWTVVDKGRIVGTVTIDGLHAEEEGAHLRWFIVSDQLRGGGYGKRLIADAIAFCQDARYSLVFLWTFKGLEAARHLYVEQGFVLTQEVSGRQWGTQVLEQRYELALAGGP